MFKPRLLFFLLFGPALLVSLPGQTVVNRALAQTAQAGAEERERGIEFYRQKKFPEAAQLLKLAVSRNKADEQSWYHLGLALMQQPHEIKDASKAFETAIELRPNFAAARAGLSYALLKEDNLTDALRQAQAAINIDPGIANAHYVAAVVRLNWLANQEALKEADEALRLDPSLAAAYLVKSQALLGLYSAKIVETVGVLRSPPDSKVSEAERWRKRKETLAPLVEAATNLETYLKLTSDDLSDGFWRQQLDTLKVFTNLDGTTSGVKVMFGRDVTTKPRILEKPEASYTKPGRHG